MSYFSNRAARVAHRLQPLGKNDRSACGVCPLAPDRTRPNGSRTACDRNDIVELISADRSRTDRSHAVLRQNNSDVKRSWATTRNPLEIFVVGFAHHFNNIFMTIQGSVSIVLGAAAGDHRHVRRFKQIEKLFSSESMLKNDLLGIVVEKGCYIDGQLQAHLLDEIIAKANTVAMRQTFCDTDGISNIPTIQSRRALRLLSGSLFLILQRLLNEIQDHIADIVADASADGTEKQRVETIAETVKRGQQLLGELRLYVGGCRLLVKRIRSETLVAAIRSACFEKREKIRCLLHIDPELHAVEMDRDWLHAILRKLCDNADEAMPCGGDLFVVIENNQSGETSPTQEKPSLESYVRVTFRDTGPGMTPEIRTRVFDPFYTTKSSRAHRGDSVLRWSTVCCGQAEAAAASIQCQGKGQRSRSICRLAIRRLRHRACGQVQRVFLNKFIVKAKRIQILTIVEVMPDNGFSH